MKFLYVTTIGSTMDFFVKIAEQLIAQGHTFDIATNESVSQVANCYIAWNCKIHHIDTCRSPFGKGNIKAIGQIKRIVKENKYDIVHCHTPIVAMCTRIACRNVRKHGTKVFYTAHVFHFFKGAPLMNWLVYYPIEKICSYLTDVLITINKEDCGLAMKSLNAKKVCYVSGVGIDLNKFGKITVEKNKEKRARYAGMNNIYYIIAGKGDLKEHLQSVIDELSLTN